MPNNPLHAIDVEQVKSTLVQREKELREGLGKYRCLMEMFHKTNVSQDKNFQRCYNGFFRMRQKPPKFYEEYFRFMERHKCEPGLTFEKILKHLYNETKKVERSFSSKMLSMINPNKPVWDRFVLKNLGMPYPPKVSAEDRIKSAVAVYENICASFEEFIETGQAKKWISLFDKHFPEGKGISAAKKIDLILWQMRR